MLSWNWFKPKAEPQPFFARYITHDTLISDNTNTKSYEILFLIKFRDQHVEDLSFIMDSTFKIIERVELRDNIVLMPKYFNPPLDWQRQLFNCLENTPEENKKGSLYVFNQSGCTATTDHETILNSHFYEPEQQTKSCSIL